MGFPARLIEELDLVGDWGVLTTDADLIVTRWNRWLEHHVGQSGRSFLGRPLFDVFPNLVVRKLDQYYRQALDGHTVILSQRLHKYILPLPPPVAGSRFEFMQQTARIMPVVEGDAVCGTLTLIEDVTERVSDETELRERVEALRDADRRKDEFLAMLAHELRNPLAPISNAAQLLRLAGQDAVMRNNARDMIERQVAHLVRLVDDLLDVSRVSRGKIALQKMPLILTAVIQHAVETSRPLIDSRRHRLTVTTPKHPVHIEADFVRLAQVLSNLLNNAAKYTDEGGEIFLSVEVVDPVPGRPGEAVIKVRDTGRGIEPSVLKNIFDLFYQVSDNLDHSDGGLGIGLSLVKSLVEMHGGHVEAKSAGRDRGSEFIVHLPILPEAPDTASPSVRQPAARAGRILVVDENRDSAESMAMLLRIDGHEVRVAHDGHKAVESAKKDRPDVVLLDLDIPGPSGVQTCERMRESGLNDLFVIAVTGYGDEEEPLHEPCFDARLIKPVELTTLRKLLSQGLAANRSPRLRPI